MKSNRDADKFGLLNHLKREYFLSKQTCVSEATYRLIPGLDLKGSTIKCLFVASGFPHERKTYLHKIPDDDADETDWEQFLDQEKKQKSKKYINIGKNKYQEPESKHKKYEMRPKDGGCRLFANIDEENVFDDMCFAKFTILYEYNIQEPEKALWHKCEGQRCEVDFAMKYWVSNISIKYGMKTQRMVALVTFLACKTL